MPNKPFTYKDSGVDIDMAQKLIERIKPDVNKTARPGLLSSVGHFAGLFDINSQGYKNPVLVSSTDGVGTKLKLALDWGKLDGLGQDLVAMSVNDILCMGAKPLFFLDYFATGKLDIDQAATVIRGITDACHEIDCTLLGGETAEMPSLYREGDFDIAGFVVGLVEKSEIIDGSKIQPGQKIIGLPSSGFHSNGFSLIRKIVSDLSPTKIVPPLNQPLRDLLLKPTTLYSNQILSLMKTFPIYGIAHITGGGLIENIPRILPPNCCATLQKNSWVHFPLFDFVQKLGNVSDEEMMRVFNCGIGLVLIVEAESSEKIIKQLESQNETAWIIGEITDKKEGEPGFEVS